MENREFAVYSYQLDSRVMILNFVVGVTALLAFMSGAVVSRWCFLLLLLPAGILLYAKRAGYDKSLLIGSRYLILGDRILYYQNVSRANLDKEKQTMTITFSKGKDLVIVAAKFPTNARKPEKIRINKANKFEKVTDRITARLRAASSDIVIT